MPIRERLPLGLTTVLMALLPLFIAFLPRGMAALLAVFSILAILAFFFAKSTAAPPLPRFSARAAWGCLAAYALVAASSLWSDSHRAFEMLRDVSYVAACLGVVFYIAGGWQPAETLRLHKILTASFIIFITLFTINVLLGFPLQAYVNNTPNAAELIATNVPKRSSALFVLFMWPVALGLYLKGYKRWAAAVLLITSGLSLLFNSTTAMIGAFGGLAVLALGRWGVRVAQSIGLAALPLGFVLMMALSLSIPNLPRSFSNHIKDTGDYRLMIWNFVGRHTLEHMPFGIGLDGSRVLPSNGETVPYNQGDILPDHPHNVYLQVWLELGIPGVLLAMFLTGLLWRRIYIMPKKLQPFMWGYVVTAAVTLAIAYGAWQAWWLAGHGLAALMLVAIARTYKEE